MATLSRIDIRPTDSDPDRWDLADPGYLAALLPAPVAFEIEAILLGQAAEQDVPIDAVAWMDDPRGVPLVAPQPMTWCWLDKGGLGPTWRRRLFLAVRTEFPIPGIYTIAVQLQDDALAVTEAEPLIAYVLSHATSGSVSVAQPAGFERVVVQELAARGTIHIRKDSGLLESWRWGAAEMPADLASSRRSPHARHITHTRPLVTACTTVQRLTHVYDP